MHFENKTIVITGASSGIGYSLAKSLPKENCSLALIARRQYLLKNLINESKKEGTIRTYQCDVGKVSETKLTFEQIKKDFGSIDIVILNSGVSLRTDIRKYSSSDAKEIFDINTLGIVNCVEQILPDFLEHKSGIIVGVTSLAESRGFPGSGFYNASKAAASLLLESLRIELKPYNIKVITVKPGFVKTPMTDKNEFHMPFMMNVDKAAKIILEGIKNEKKVIQFPFPIVLGSKILKFMPDWLFDYLMSKKLPSRKDKISAV